MKTTTARPSPLTPPYVSHVPGESSPRLERGPDQSYSGPAIRVDLAGFGGAFHLGFEGDTMAERPDDYAGHVIACCNAAPLLAASLRRVLNAGTGGRETVSAWSEAQDLLASLGGSTVTPSPLPSCQRCGSDLDAQGHCTDETCPFSDCAQSDPKGWEGHPDPLVTIHDPRFPAMAHLKNLP